MSLGEHLLELRKRIMWAAAGITVGGIAGWFLSAFFWDAIRVPIAAMTTGAINYSNVTTAFDLKLQLSVTIGLVVSSPVWLFQIFAYLVPGLTKKERKYTLGFFFSAVPLFLLGCAAGWYVLPHVVGVLTQFVPTQDSAFIEARDYMTFVLKLVLAVGIAFVLPVFLVLLNFLGVIQATTILKAWRIALLLILVFCALATPSADVLSMFLLAIPMVLLYYSAAGVAVWHDKGIARRTAKELAMSGTGTDLLA